MTSIAMRLLERNDKEENEQILSKIFGKLYTNGKVMVEFDQKLLEVIFEDGDESDRTEPIKVPLFKDIFTKDEGEVKQNNLSGSPIVVFHSYKGGVGRTLALISLVREISEIYGPKNDTDNAVIMEFKVRDLKEEASLEDTAEMALKQIEKQQYEAALQNRGISVERIRKYGFAFEGKEVLISRH